MIRFSIITALMFWSVACGPSVRFSSTKSPEDKPAIKAASNDLNEFVKQWTGTPYLLGGMARNGIDCSGFTSVLYQTVYKISLSRQAQDQYQEGIPVRKSSIRPGDLVFFHIVRGGKIDHVGVYLGDGRFAHASTNAGVIISSLDETYYRKRFTGARRYF